MKSFVIDVDPKLDGMRLDLALVAADLGLSRRRLRAIIDAGGVYVNKHRVRIASRTVHRGDRIRVEYSEAALEKLKSEKLGFKEADILYDDHDIVAVNKPPGMPAQATRDQAVLHVAVCLTAYYREQSIPGRKFVLVHRLDKETSGVMLLATNNAQATWLTDQFRERQVKKRYLAICYGLPKQDAFTERCYLSAIDRKSGDVRPVKAGGKAAVTHFKLLAANRQLGICLLACEPETGRSHQIRVHLEMNGLPIIGDKRYGKHHKAKLPEALIELAATHHFLHAESLQFKLGLAGQPIKIEASLPANMQRFLQLAGLSK